MSIEVVEVPPTTVEAVPVVAGTRGPVGPAGAAGIVHVEPVPVASWTITHELGRLPIVTFVVDGQPVSTRCTVTDTHVYAEWPYPVAGTAVLV